VLTAVPAEETEALPQRRCRALLREHRARKSERGGRATGIKERERRERRESGDDEERSAGREKRAMMVREKKTFFSLFLCSAHLCSASAQTASVIGPLCEVVGLDGGEQEAEKESA
jgi:hypothetical protein